MHVREPAPVQRSRPQTDEPAPAKPGHTALRGLGFDAQEASLRPGAPVQRYGGGKGGALVSGGPELATVQEKLNQLGFECGAADGLMGPQTQAAVIAFQKDHGLAPDGLIGPLTLDALGIDPGGPAAASGAGAVSGGPNPQGAAPGAGGVSPPSTASGMEEKKEGAPPEGTSEGSTRRDMTREEWAWYRLESANELEAYANSEQGETAAMPGDMGPIAMAHFEKGQQFLATGRTFTQTAQAMLVSETTEFETVISYLWVAIDNLNNARTEFVEACHYHLPLTVAEDEPAPAPEEPAQDGDEGS